MHYKRNQVEEAIFRTLAAQDARADELKFRLKRLLVTDRRLGRDANSDEGRDRHYAFYSQDPPGSGTEVMFSGYEAFALLVALLLLEHGVPQAGVVKVMRQVRKPFETARAESLKRDPNKLFDEQAIRAQAQPGMLAFNNTDPVFLVFARLTGSSIGDPEDDAAVAICNGRTAFGKFMEKHAIPGMGTTFFECVGLMHRLDSHLLQVEPAKRGRGAT